MLIDEILGWIKLNLKDLIQIVLFPGIAFILIFAVAATWFERKYLAHSMLRIGPLHTGRVAGWLQIIADFIKLTGKEVITPRNVNVFLFNLLPVLSVCTSAIAVAFIPFSSDWIIYEGNGISLLLFFAAASLTPYITLMLGWISNNKYSIIGAMRVSYVYISAEIPAFLAAMGVAIMAGSFSLIDIVEAQSRIPFLIPQILGFIVFFIAFLAEVERVPFDIPVAEQEIVAGWRTEYSGINFGVTMMMDYIPLCTWTLLFVTLYLGGYQGPLIFASQTLSNFFWILLKFSLVIVVILLFRSVFPRLRMDQTLRLTWKYLTPAAFLNLIITAIIAYYYPDLFGLIGAS